MSFDPSQFKSLPLDQDGDGLLDLEIIRGHPNFIVDPDTVTPAIGAGIGAGVPSMPLLAASRAPLSKGALNLLASTVALKGADGLRCSGVVVGPFHVLTARHCAPVATIAIGPNADKPTASIAVRRTITHPNELVDLALLEVDSLAGLRPLARRGLRDAAPPRGRLRIVGFGSNRTLGTGGEGIERHGDVLVTGWGCDNARELAGSCASSHEMVVSSPTGVDTCDGDSGGPLVEPNGAYYRLVGVTSRALRTSTTRRCGDGGVYTRVDVVDEWLSSSVSAAAPRKQGDQ